MKVEIQNPEEIQRRFREQAAAAAGLQANLAKVRSRLLQPPPRQEFRKIRHPNARLEDILIAFHESSDRVGRRLVWLTIALVVLTAWLAVLTALLVLV